MQSKNHGRTPMQKSDLQRAAYATLLKSHPRTGSPPQIHCILTKTSPRRTSPEGCFCIDVQLVKILKLGFVKRNLLKVKTHEIIVLIDWDRWKRLYT